VNGDYLPPMKNRSGIAQANQQTKPNCTRQINLLPYLAIKPAHFPHRNVPKGYNSSYVRRHKNLKAESRNQIVSTIMHAINCRQNFDRKPVDPSNAPPEEAPVDRNDCFVHLSIIEEGR
jgi:hypothetical protein